MTSRAAKRQKADNGQPIDTTPAPQPAPVKEPVKEPAPVKTPEVEDASESSSSDDDESSTSVPKKAPRNLIKVRDSRSLMSQSSLHWKRLRLPWWLLTRIIIIELGHG